MASVLGRDDCPNAISGVDLTVARRVHGPASEPQKGLARHSRNNRRQLAFGPGFSLRRFAKCGTSTNRLFRDVLAAKNEGNARRGET
jgi:hypothetical protein